MVIAIGADHGGFEQKAQLKAYIQDAGHTVVDFGTESDESVDYPDFAERVAREVAEGNADFGVLICGTGVGMAIAANKIRGIRAANVTTPEFAKLSREHNNANVVTLSGRFVTPQENTAIIDAFLNTPFAGDRHERRVAKIIALED